MTTRISIRHWGLCIGMAIALGAPGCANIGLAGASFTPDLSKRTPGFNVSHFQGTDIDWTAAKAQGNAFVFAKASEGVDSPDATFATHVKGANAAGLPIGGYHFFQLGDPGVAQAEYYLQTLAGQPLQLPPTLDLEGAPSAEDLKQAVAWLDHVQSATKCQPLLYLDLSIYKEIAPMLPRGQPIWLAEYASALPSDGLPPALWFWQHSETGKVQGISGDVDIDWFFGAAGDLGKLRCDALATAD